MLFSAIRLLALLLVASPALARSFTLGGLQAADQIIPLKQYAGDAKALRMLLNPPILYLQSDGRVVCMLCKEAPEVSLRRNDDKQVTEQVVSLVLKKKLSWGDGQSLTREDVKYTLYTMALAPYPEGQRPILPIARIEFDKNQANKIDIVLRSRRPDAIQLFAISLLPKHKAAQIELALKQPPLSPAYWKLVNDPAFYYGSYRVAAGNATQLSLEANLENDWENTAKDPMVFKFIADLPALAQALEKEEIDQTLNRELSWAQYQDLLKIAPKLVERYEPRFTPGQTLEVMLLNMRSPFLLNPAMRLALYRGINREALNAAHYQGGGLPTDSLLHPDLLKRAGEKPHDGYHPETAGTLLDQAGWKMGKDGWRYGERQQKLSLVLSCSETRLQAGWHESVKKDLNKLGIDLQIEQVPDADYLRQTLGHLRFKDSACMRWRLPALSPPIQLFHSLAIPDAENSYDGLNFSGWEQTGVNRILESMMRETETAMLLRLFGRLERHFIGDMPAIPLVYLPEVTLSRKLGPDTQGQDLQKTLATYPVDGERNKAHF